MFEQSLKEMMELAMWIPEKRISSTGNSQCKDAKAGVCMVVHFML